MTRLKESIPITVTFSKAPTTSASAASRSQRWLVLLAFAGLAWFVIAAGVIHGIRSDLDPVASQMSLYLIGDAGLLLQSAYAALGLAMCGLALNLYRSAPRETRSALPLLLFVLAAVSLTTTAFAWMDMPGTGRTLQGLIHHISAYGAFLFATTGITVQSLCFRRDPFWRRYSTGLLFLALACLAAVLVLASWRELPRGLAQKAVIAMILGWLALVTLRAGQQSRTRAADAAAGTLSSASTVTPARSS